VSGAPQIDPVTGLAHGHPVRPDWEVTPRQLADLLAQGLPDGGLLVDCRRDEEFAFNRIAGAVHIEMGQIEKRADELEDDEGKRTRPVYVYCHHGMRSMRVAATLRALGFPNAKSLAGGIDAWSAGIDPSVPRY
jgi:rhodanese-related sulfurtransferase